MVQIFDKYGVLKRPAILGVASWGSIVGTITAQTDLIAYLSSNYVPLSRTLTINGLTYDLSADRSWTISGAAWGSITGTLSSQTDLITFLSTTYFPIPTGTTAEYVRGDGSLATFPSIPTVTPAALSKTDDTNVTLTFSGTPTTALLQAVGITVGWTGTLADSRIASAAIWNAKQNAITTGTTAQYFRGDLSLATFPTLGNWSALNYPTWISGTPFVKMTAAGTFALDTNTYITSVGTGVANELTYWSGINTLGSLTTATYPSLTELSYVKGVTSSIQTQLDARRKVLIVDTPTASGVSSTLIETVIGSYLIPANTFSSNDIMNVQSLKFKSNAAGGTVQYRYYINTVGSLSGTPSLLGGFLQTTGTSVTSKIGGRTYSIVGGNIEGNTTTGSGGQTDTGQSATALTSYSLNLAVDQYIVITAQLGTATANNARLVEILITR